MSSIHLEHIYELLHGGHDMNHIVDAIKKRGSQIDGNDMTNLLNSLIAKGYITKETSDQLWSATRRNSSILNRILRTKPDATEGTGVVPASALTGSATVLKQDDDDDGDFNGNDANTESNANKPANDIMKKFMPDPASMDMQGGSTEDTEMHDENSEGDGNEEGHSQEQGQGHHDDETQSVGSANSEMTDLSVMSAGPAASVHSGPFSVKPQPTGSPFDAFHQQ